MAVGSCRGYRFIYLVAMIRSAGSCPELGSLSGLCGKICPDLGNEDSGKQANARGERNGSCPNAGKALEPLQAGQGVSSPGPGGDNDFDPTGFNVTITPEL